MYKREHKVKETRLRKKRQETKKEEEEKKNERENASEKKRAKEKPKKKTKSVARQLTGCRLKREDERDERDDGPFACGSSGYGERGRGERN